MPPSYSPSEPVKRTNGPTPTVRRVGSTVGSEDDRSMQKPPPTSRPRQLSAATTYTAPSFTRVRASSTTTDPSTAVSVSNSSFLSKHTLSESNTALADQHSASGSIPKRKAPPQELNLNVSRSTRTRTVARSRESLDLEDIMSGSDDDGIGEMKPFVSQKQHDRQRGFSTSTRDLIAFLAEGPPELTPREGSSLSPTPKKSGRLQKMISRITLAGDTVKSPRKTTFGSGDASSKSMTNLSPLANRPVPPRYPTSGPPSATSSERGFVDQVGTYPRQRAQSHVQKPLPSWDGKSTERETLGSPVPSCSPRMEGAPLRTSPVSMVSQRTLETDMSQHTRPTELSPSSSASLPPIPSITVPIRVETTDTSATSPPLPTVPQRVSSKAASSVRQKVAPAPTPQTVASVPSVLEHARELRTMLEHATSAAECRILVDMFLARSKLSVDVANLQDLAAPSPPRDFCVSGLESTIVELFLGDGDLGDSDPDIRHRISVDSRSTELAETPLEVAGAILSTPSAASPTGSSKPR